MYTRAKDYELYCGNQQLAQVVNTDLANKRMAENIIEDMIIGYLGHRYNFSKPYGEFTDTTVWNATTVYKANNRVYLDASAYSASSTYLVDALVLQAGNVYICINDIITPESFNPVNWELLGAQYDLFFVTPPFEPWNFQKTYNPGDLIYYKDNTYTSAVQSTNIAPDSKYGSVYWGTGSLFTIPAGVLPTDTDYWTEGDNRNNFILSIYMLLVIYHMNIKIAPRNITQPLKDEKEESIKRLIEIGAGSPISGFLPLIVPEQGSAIRWGSINKTENLY